MAIDIKIERFVEKDSKGKVWAVRKESWVNGDDQKTERIVRSLWKKKDIKIEREKHKENYDIQMNEYNDLTLTKSILPTDEYKEFKERIKSGDLVELYKTYLFELLVEGNIKSNKTKAKDVDDHIEIELSKVNKILNELEEYKSQIDEGVKLLK